jgi:peroxiredoxin Q/BCP
MRTPLVLSALLTLTAAALPAAAQTPPPSQAPLVVRSPARTALLAVGDPSPDFTAATHDGRTVSSGGSARARALVVYFYPRDETPGCTREAEAFRDLRAQLDAAGADVVGVSTDSLQSHASFAQAHQLNFSLVADPDGALGRAFGLSVSGFAPRTTFVIGRDGRIARVFPSVRVDGHAAEVLAAVRALAPAAPAAPAARRR